MTDRDRGSSRRKEGGYTLLELLAVMMILSVLMGIGVGFLKAGGNPLDRAALQVRDLLRAARARARFLGASTRVTIRTTDPEEGSVSVRAFALVPVAEWNFETRGFGPRGEILAGRVEEGRGRFGNGLVLTGEGGKPGFFLPASEARTLDPRRGFSLQADWKPESVESCILFRLGRSLSLGVAPSGVLEAAVLLTGERGEPGRRVLLKGFRPVLPGAWTHLRLFSDGERLVLEKDGVEEAVADLGNEIWLDREGEFTISEPSDPANGIVDEVVYDAFTEIARVDLPPGLRIQAPESLVFAPDGRLDRRLHPDAPILLLTFEDQREEIRFDAGGMPR